MHDANCLFCKIVAGKIPSKIVHEDDEIFAFHDIHPWAPVHFLMVPKLHILSFAQLEPEHVGLLGRMMDWHPSWPCRRAAGPTRRAVFASSPTPASRAGRRCITCMFT